MKKIILLYLSVLLHSTLFASHYVFNKKFSWKNWEIHVHPEALNEEITNLYRCPVANYFLKDYLDDALFHLIDFNGDDIVDIVFEGNVADDCCIHTVLFQGKREQDCGKYELVEIFYGEVISLIDTKSSLSFLIKEVSKIEGEMMHCVFQFDWHKDKDQYEVSQEVLINEATVFPEEFKWQPSNNVLLFKNSPIYHSEEHTDMIGHLKYNNYTAQVLYEGEGYYFVSFPLHALRRRDFQNYAPFRNKDTAVNVLGWISKDNY